MRRSELDLSRITACVLVILIHITYNAFYSCYIYSESFVPLIFLCTLARGSVGVFFMISGALFLARQEISPAELIKKNVVKLITVFFVWSAVYALGAYIEDRTMPVSDICLRIVTGQYHMWFLWAMIVCYLFLPPVHSALHGKKLDVKYLLILFAIVGLLPVNSDLLILRPHPVLHRMTENLSIKYLPYMGYMIWGYYLSGKKWSRKWLWLGPVLMLAVTAAATAGNVWYSRLRDSVDGWLFDSLSVPSFLQATLLFVAFQPLRGTVLKRERTIRVLSDCTLGVYMVHPLVIAVMRRVGLVVGGESPLKDLAVLLPAVILICFAGVWIGRKLPILKKIL